MVKASLSLTAGKRWTPWDLIHSFHSQCFFVCNIRDEKIMSHVLYFRKLIKVLRYILIIAKNNFETVGNPKI